MAAKKISGRIWTRRSSDGANGRGVDIAAPWHSICRRKRQGSSAVEQGTHKPLVGSSILPSGIFPRGPSWARRNLDPPGESPGRRHLPRSVFLFFADGNKATVNAEFLLAPMPGNKCGGFSFFKSSNRTAAWIWKRLAPGWNRPEGKGSPARELLVRPFSQKRGRARIAQSVAPPCHHQSPKCGRVLADRSR